MRARAMLGWGVLGCGDITDKRAAPAIIAQEQSRLVCFHSRTASQAEAFARRHGAAGWTVSREELLADPEVAAAYVATEHYRHCEDVVAAAESGKHVLCEKPMAKWALERQPAKRNTQLLAVASLGAVQRAGAPAMHPVFPEIADSMGIEANDRLSCVRAILTPT